MLEFTTLSGHAKCAAALVAALSLAERLAIRLFELDKSRSFANWQAVIDYARDTNIRSQSGEPILAFEYLSTAAQNRPKQRRRVKRQSVSPRVAVSELITNIASHYFRNGGALHHTQQTLHSEDRPEFVLFDFLYGLAQPKDKNEEDFYADTIKSLEENHNDDGIVFVEFVKTCFGDLQNIPHIDFSSMPLLSMEAIQAEFHGVLSKDGQSLRSPSLFAVIREARGWTTEDRSQGYVNAVVRDILWIEDPDKATTVNNSTRGFYYSSLDNHIYLASNIARDRMDGKDRPNILINADMGELGRANHFYLFFPLIKRKIPLWMEDGVIAGTATTVDQLAAWKVLLIQPDWEFAQRLETVLFIQHRDRQYKEMSRLLLSSGVGAQLFNQSVFGIAEHAACRDAFRRLLFPSNPPGSIDRALGGQLKTSLTMAFHQTLSESASQLLGGEINLADINGIVQELVDRLIHDIENEITSRWHLIEPAQIMTFLSHTEKARHSMQRTEIKSLIATLLILQRTGRSPAFPDKGFRSL